MQATPIITIIIALYNKEKWLSKAIDSILMQETDYQYKILIIDDLSTDNGFSIAKDYEVRYPDKFVVLQNEEKLYCFGTVLKAWKIMGTNYWTVLDADDYWLTSDRLQNALSYMESHPNITAYMSNTFLVTSEDQSTYKPWIGTNILNKTIRQYNYHKYIGVGGHTSAVTYKNFFTKEDFDKLDKIDSSSDMKYYDGETFRTCLAISCGDVYFNNKIESVYYLHGAGIWSSLSNQEQNFLNIFVYLKMFTFIGNKSIELLEIFYDKFLTYKPDINNAETYSNIENSIKTLVNYKSIIKTHMFDSIYFYCPSHYIGGLEFQLYGFAEYLAQEYQLPIYYIDYKDGFISKCTQSSNVHHLVYTDKTKKLNIHENSILVAPFTLFNQIPILKNAYKHLYWVAHPSSFEWMQGRSKLTADQMHRVIKTLNEHKSICYMDNSCYYSLSAKVDFPLYKQYVPTFVNPKDIKNTVAIKETDAINLAWLGRLDKDKIYSLINTLDNFNLYQTTLRKKIHIIGDGDSKHLINLEKYSNIEIIFCSTLLHQERDEYLINHADILIGMGTSLLEGASLNMPALCTIFTLSPIDNKDNYLWLYKFKDFDLGIFMGDRDKFSYSWLSLDTVLDDIYTHYNIEYHKNASYSYAMINHSVKNSVLLLLVAALQSSYKIKKQPLTTKIKNFAKKMLSKKQKDLLKKIIKKFR